MKKDLYEDIINLNHYISKKHPQMNRKSRAAQFASFAALKGYEEAVNETARKTNKKIEIDEEMKIILNNKLQIINKNIKNKPKINFTYFVYDNNKSGGKYLNINENVKKIDKDTNSIIFCNGESIQIKEIISINGELFKDIEDI